METVPDHRTLGAGRRYQRHRPEQTSLYPIVERHLPALRDELQRHEGTLPRFVLAEFQDYLRCGRLEFGFVRVQCNGCRHEHFGWPAACVPPQTPGLLPVLRPAAQVVNDCARPLTPE